MEPEIIEILKENNKLLRENLELSQENTKKIKRIQSYMRRTFIARVSYWILIILVTGGALYVVHPYAKKVIHSYNTIKEDIDTTTGILDKPGSLFKDVGMLNKLFEVFSEKDIMTQNEQ